MSIEQSPGQSVDATLARVWELSSEKGRREIVGNIVVSLGIPGIERFGKVSVDSIPEISDFEDLPVAFQGHLTIACTPDGWDYSRVRRFAEICMNVPTNPS